MEALEKMKLLQAIYAGALADAVLRMGREGVLEKVEAAKRQEQLLTGAVRARQLGIETAKGVIPALTDLMGCANWVISPKEDGNGFTAVATSCMLCAMAKRMGAPSPCHIYCLDPMEGMMKGLDGQLTYTVQETLWDGKQCRLEVEKG